MSRIDELIQQLCPDGVEYKPLGDIVNILDSQRKPISKEKRIPGKIPYYGANGIQGYVKDFIFDGIFLLIGEDGSVINKDGSPVLNWAEGKIWVNNHAHILTEKKDIASLRFIFFFLQTYDVTPVVRGTPPKMTQQSLREIMIPVPPLPVQEEIVRILGKFTALEAELEAELEARRKQYEFYRDQLLTFGDEVEWKPLGGEQGIAELGTGSHNTIDAIENGNYRFYVRSDNILHMNTYDYDEEAIITSGDGVGVGKIIHYVNGKYALHQRAYRIRLKSSDSLSTKFIFYYMKVHFQKYILGSAVNSSVTSIRRHMLERFQIPVPPRPEQERIVAILDKFDALVNDISSGLPAELEMRRKQYEYYRDRLLTFKPLAKEA